MKWGEVKGQSTTHSTKCQTFHLTVTHPVIYYYTRLLVSRLILSSLKHTFIYAFWKLLPITNAIHFKPKINMCIHAFGRCFYSEWLALHLRCALQQFMHLLRIKPITATVWATGMIVTCAIDICMHRHIYALKLAIHLFKIFILKKWT